MQDLFPRFPRALERPSILIELIQAIEDRKDLRRFPELPAQLMGPQVGLLDIYGAIAFGDLERRPQGQLHPQLLRRTLGVVWPLCCRSSSPRFRCPTAS